MSATFRPYHEHTSEGLQLLHWEVVISTPERDVIEIVSNRTDAKKRAATINGAKA